MLSISSKLLKTWSGLTRWLLWATVLAWLTFGVFWATMHWLIVPRIGEFRPLLEAQASQALGVTVRVGAVSARSSGLTPSFELTDVALFDSMGRIALSLPRVLVALSPRSLWRLGYEQLYIDRPMLDIRRAADGRITIAGLRAGEPLVRFRANWYCTRDLDPAWDLLDTGWHVSVAGDAPLEVDLRMPVPLERMAEISPAYTANRAVNAVPHVCAAQPGIATTLDLPQLFPTFG